MRDQLAESLLARVMGWDQEDVARERPRLQALADHKYDSYEQYQPGMRFIESLARWLTQFTGQAERDKAYEFVRSRLIFISRAELQHLVAGVYPDVVRPRLLARAAHDEGMEPHLVGEVMRGRAFKVRARSCLYVGMSDGAHTDVLRRSARVISNEQVVADYHSLSNRARGLREELSKDLEPPLGTAASEEARFTTVILLDDFSASGISYIRSEGGERAGKIARIVKQLSDAKELLASEDLEIYVVLYLATDRALRHLKDELPKLPGLPPGALKGVHAIQPLGEELVIRRGDDPDLDGLMGTAYAPEINDVHMQKGGTDGKYGFADCGLPLVLPHNTPNNSIAMLWAEVGGAKGLFPRVTRHREES